jgi:DNA repair photolyase
MQTTTIIGQPKPPPTGTQEWAASNVNIQDGCEHDCRYCYAKTMAIRFKRMTAKSWAEPKLREHDVNRGFTRRSGRIMFPTAHDITEKNIEACIGVLKKMLAAGNDVLIVSKPCMTCVERLCSELAPFRNQIVFRFSIGSASNAVLKYWEPGAPMFKQRLACLKAAYLHDFQTSVSCEPMLDDRIDRVVDAVHPFVTDSIWLGKINRLRSILPQTCPGDAEAVRKGEVLMASQSDNAIRNLYARYQHDTKIKWKDSIKKVVGLDRPTNSGLDI